MDYIKSIFFYNYLTQLIKGIFGFFKLIEFIIVSINLSYSLILFKYASELNLKLKEYKVILSFLLKTYK